MITQMRKRIKEGIFKDIIGQKHVKSQVKSALVAGRNIVIVGPPGVGKTTLAKNIAGLLPDLEVSNCGYNCLPSKPVCPTCLKKQSQTKIVQGTKRFVRIQGSPDLTSEDLLGDIDPIKALKFGAMSLEAFTPGKIFKANNGVLFFDELNRCPEKLQNSLLQVLEEKKLTIGGYDVDFDLDFIFIGTMNPEDSSTEKLSDVLVDRFDIVYMTYPRDVETEKKIVKTSGQSFSNFPEDLLNFTLKFIESLRQDENLEKKPSVRASIGLYERAQANAFIAGREDVTFNDVRDAVISVLSHRIRLTPSKKYLTKPRDYISAQFAKFSDATISASKEVGDDP